MWCPSPRSVAAKSVSVHSFATNLVQNQHLRAIENLSSFLLPWTLTSHRSTQGEQELLQMLTRTTVDQFRIDRTASYEYDTLPSPDHFRCFELLPGDWNAPLSGRMVYHSLYDEPEYEAISYMWGGADPTTLVDCGYGSLAITTNVATMFRRLRLHDEPRKLWIDTICINQKNPEEKTIQVQRMANIYSKCSRLIIWLGEEDRSTEYAMKMLECLDEVVDQAWNASGANWPSLEKLQEFGLPARLDRRWLCLQTLLHNKWFTRTWILQEVSLATNPWIQRGSYVFDWKKIVRIVLCLCRVYINHFYGLNFRHVYMVSYFCSSRSWWHDPSLISLLHSTLTCSSTLKVDRVFALIGLSAERRDLQHLIKYKAAGNADLEHVKMVYTKVAIHFLLKGNLTVLNLASDPSLRDLTTLPSWVPDWSSWTRAEPLIGYNFLAEGLYGPARQKEMASAPRLINERTVLVLKGNIVGQIHRVGRRVPAIEKVSDRWIGLKFIRQWRHIAGKQAIYCNDEPMEEAFARTITMNMPSELLEQHDYGDLYQRYLAQFPRQKWALPMKEEGTYDELYEFRTRLMAAARLRSFFKTKDGLLGMGPYCLRSGDHVVEFDGGVTPYVIRRVKGGQYRLVGDAYIHDMKSQTNGTYMQDVYLV